MLPKKLRHNPGRFRAIVYAVLVHAVLIGLAVIGFRWTVQSPSSEVVQAVAVPEAPTRKPEETNQRAQEEEAARRQAEDAEKRRQDELKKKQEEEQTQQRLVAERKKKEAEEKERQKRAQEEVRRNEEKRRQKLAEQTLQEQLAAEEQQTRQQAAQSARAATAADKYRALIRQRVSQSWNPPVGVAKGLKCVVNVRLAPGGKVLSARVVRSSGNAVFDRSVENAVYKAEPLPLPEDPTLFDNFREIEFLFSPEE